ncbi:MAG: GNAT family N-acetyltransferase [Bacteroidota bacterium]
MITLRNINSQDFQYLHWIENLEEFWKINEHPGPYSYDEIEDFFSTPFRYYLHKQQRWILYELDLKKNLGVIDVFSFREDIQEIGVGILIPKPEDRNRGVGKKSLELLIDLLRKEGKIKSIFALIDQDNFPSKKLFESCSFAYCGNKVYLNRIVEEYKIQIND